MGDYFIGLAGTSQGETVSMVLALVSAFAHAVFAALTKHGDPYLNRGAINLAYSIIAAPFALFVFPLPAGQLIPILALSFFLHVGYEWLQSAAFSRGAFTLVYPISRGTSPIVTAMLAIIIFSETLVFSQWIGLLLLSGAIASLAAVNLQQVPLNDTMRATLLPSIILAIGAGIAISLYTTVDAYGIRLSVDPFTFLAWFFFLGGFGSPVIGWFHWRSLETKPPVRPLFIRGLIGAFIAYFSFATLMLATLVGKVSEAAALRETSIVFATGIGFIFFKEHLTAAKLIVIGLIAIGAILIEYH